MHFASDNAGPVHPSVLAALTEANLGYAPPYGADPLTEKVQHRIREIFDSPHAEVLLVATGTAANVLSLATLAEPTQTIFCADCAHIHEDECNAPEFYTGGAKLTLVPAPDGKMRPAALAAAIEREETRGVHGPQRGPVSLTNVTEKGSVYSVGEIEELAALARGYGLPVHLDGARFANALAATNAAPADMTWRAGVDALSFGGTKNGLMGVEAVVLFDPARAWEFELRRKRGAHLFSKHRYLAAQMSAYLEGDLWLTMARAANTAAARLVAGLETLPEVELVYPPDANIVFARWPRALHEKLIKAGAVYNIYDAGLDDAPADAPLTARLVCDWSTGPADIDRFLALMRG